MLPTMSVRCRRGAQSLFLRMMATRIVSVACTTPEARFQSIWVIIMAVITSHGVVTCFDPPLIPHRPHHRAPLGKFYAVLNLFLLVCWFVFRSYSAFAVTSSMYIPSIPSSSSIPSNSIIYLALLLLVLDQVSYSLLDCLSLCLSVSVCLSFRLYVFLFSSFNHICTLYLSFPSHRLAIISPSSTHVVLPASLPRGTCRPPTP